MRLNLKNEMIFKILEWINYFVTCIAIVNKSKNKMGILKYGANSFFEVQGRAIRYLLKKAPTKFQTL